jgi:Cof subfamily protein (haloacid dehalogenase superfamily)
MMADAAAPGSPSERISLVVSDVDGTLVTPDKLVAPSTIEAAQELRRAGIPLAAVSSRPPRGMASIARALALEVFAGFNGAVIVDADLNPLEENFVPVDAAESAVAGLRAAGADIWVFAGEDWLVTDLDGEYVAHERRTVGFEPTLVTDFDGHLARVGKIVGASSDYAMLAALEVDLSAKLGRRAVARRSQRYYLDVTHPTADKGHAVRAFAGRWGVPLAEVAVLGDQANDLPMFDVAGLSIAMANGTAEAKGKANFTTGPNDGGGWAAAIRDIVLPRVRAGKTVPAGRDADAS